MAGVSASADASMASVSASAGAVDGSAAQENRRAVNVVHCRPQLMIEEANEGQLASLVPVVGVAVPLVKRRRLALVVGGG